jgi:transcriptional regulator with XRE-family HTH domain
VKELRKALKLTQDGLCARIAHVTQGAWNPDKQEVFKIEAGQRLVSDLEVVTLANALECDACYLLIGEEKNTEKGQ